MRRLAAIALLLLSGCATAPIPDARPAPRIPPILAAAFSPFLPVAGGEGRGEEASIVAPSVSVPAAQIVLSWSFEFDQHPNAIIDSSPDLVTWSTRAALSGPATNYTDVVNAPARFYRVHAPANNIILAWSPATDPRVTGYWLNVQYQTARGVKQARLDCGTNCTAVLTDQVTAAPVTYQVTGYDAAGAESAPSNFLTLTLTTNQVWAAIHAALTP